jgi:hypothetical protein
VCGLRGWVLRRTGPGHRLQGAEGGADDRVVMALIHTEVQDIKEMQKGFSFAGSGGTLRIYSGTRGDTGEVHT